jgi:LacI family transcriptional regulator, galactose operon repressor
VARRLGYQRDVLASGLKRGRSQTVAVVVGDLTNMNVTPVLRGIANALEPQGMMPLICETQDDSERLQRIVNQLISRRIDSMLVIAARLGDAPILRRLRRLGVPTVLAVQIVPGVRLPSCTYDDYLGGRLAAQHLLSLGHRRLAQLRGPEDIWACVQRAAGFSRAVAEAGATEIVVKETAPTGSPDDGRRLMRQLMNRKGALPTGIFVHHDLMGFGALALAAEHGLTVPRDFSLVGYHDLPHVEMITPPLTSVRLPREELGRIAAEIMLDLMQSPDHKPTTHKLQPTLVVRQSTAPAPKVR